MGYIAALRGCSVPYAAASVECKTFGAEFKMEVGGWILSYACCAVGLLVTFCCSSWEGRAKGRVRVSKGRGTGA